METWIALGLPFLPSALCAQTSVVKSQSALPAAPSPTESLGAQWLRTLMAMCPEPSV